MATEPWKNWILVVMEQFINIIFAWIVIVVWLESVLSMEIFFGIGDSFGIWDFIYKLWKEKNANMNSNIDSIKVPIAMVSQYGNCNENSIIAIITTIKQ